MTASEMGKLGAQARIRATTSEQRKTWARKAGKASGKARRKKKVIAWNDPNKVYAIIYKEKSNVATSQETNKTAQL